MSKRLSLKGLGQVRVKNKFPETITHTETKSHSGKSLISVFQEFSVH